jgi:hypothetical protein
MIFSWNPVQHLTNFFLVFLDQISLQISRQNVFLAVLSDYPHKTNSQPANLHVLIGVKFIDLLTLHWCIRCYRLTAVPSIEKRFQTRAPLGILFLL